jgi:hypothetical protein
MQTKMSILFLLKRTKSTTDGLTPIYLRVTFSANVLKILSIYNLSGARLQHDI